MVYTHQKNAKCSSGDTKLYHYRIISIHHSYVQNANVVKNTVTCCAIKCKVVCFIFCQKNKHRFKWKDRQLYINTFIDLYFKIKSVIIFLCTQKIFLKDFVNVIKVRLGSNFYFIYQYGARHKNKSISVW